MAHQSTRVAAIDIARGMSVVCVVIGHVAMGLFDSGALPRDGALGIAYDVTHVFRVPAIAFVAGLFIPRALARHGGPRYLADRALLLGWLYLVWTAVQTVVEVATNPIRNTPRPVDLSILMVWTPAAQLYFLPALWLSTAATVLLLGRRQGFAKLAGLGVAAAISLAAWGWRPPVVGIDSLGLVVFVALGAAVGLPRMSTAARGHPALWVAVTFAAGGLFAWAWSSGARGPLDPSTFDPLGRTAGMAAVLCGIVVTIGIAVLVASLPLLGASLERIGRLTLPVFLAHIVFAAGARIVLQVIDVPPGIVLVVASVVGVAGPVVLARVAPLTRLGWLFDRPRSGRTTVTTTAQRPLTADR